MQQKEYKEKYYKKVARLGLFQFITNLVLSIIKLVGGFISTSSALISDGVDSLGDVVTSFIGMIGNKLSSKKADDTHEFGHEKIENLVTFIFSLVLIASAGFLIYDAIISLIDKTYVNIDISYKLLIGLGIAFISLITKFIMGLVVFKESKKNNSPLLKAQALDHYLDSIGTLLTFFSLLFIYIFADNELFRILDPISSIIISLIFASGALQIFIENSKALIDHSSPKKIKEEVIKEILSVEGVIHIDSFRSRIAANRIFIEVEITVDGNLSLYDAHKISEVVKEKVLNSHLEIKNCLVHVNPEIHDDGNLPFN